MPIARTRLVAALTIAGFLVCSNAAAEDFAFGGSYRGYGGIVSADSSLGVGVGQDEPDPLRGADPRAAGVRGAGGFGSELYLAVHDFRFGLDANVFFSDAYRVSSGVLPNSFTASTRSATTYDFDLFIGHMFEIGSVRPYVDLRGGIGVLQTSIRLQHPALGFVGATQYDAVRFLFGPRAGVYIPLGGPFFIDTGVEVGLLGFSRVLGYAGLAVKLGSDERRARTQPRDPPQLIE